MSSPCLAALAAAAMLLLAGCGATANDQKAVATSVGATAPTSPPPNVLPTTTATLGTGAPPATAADTTPAGGITGTSRAADTTGGQAAVSVLVRGAGFCTHLPTAPSPECDPRPLPGAGVAFRDSGGSITARDTTGADGTVTVTVPPGTYTVLSDPVPGFDLTAQPETVTAEVGKSAGVTLTHNTGYQ